MKLEFQKKGFRNLKDRIEGYYFDVGILEDAEHKQAKESPMRGTPDLKTFAGGPARKITARGSGVQVSDVFIQNQERLGTNLLAEPFQKKNSEIIRFTHEFLSHVMGKPKTRRVENLIQAIVRNPILRQDYGGNRAGTADAKGFDRHLIDTAQMFRRITAKITKVVGRV